MKSMSLDDPSERTTPRWVLVGFVYWAAFLLALEPDNILRAVRAGHGLALDHEILRIAAAAAIGSVVTPVLVWMTVRYPIAGAMRWRHATVHAVAGVALAFVLIVMSCVAAAWGFENRWLPSLTEVGGQLKSNWTLLIFALGVFTAITHGVRVSGKTAGACETVGRARPLSRIPVKTKGRMTYIDTASVDWVETHGNYLALHVGAATHLIRETLGQFEMQLDADRFLRIHRRTLVAVDRIQSIQPVGNGDAMLTLADGRQLRVSRRHRQAVGDKWPARRSSTASSPSVSTMPR